MENLIKKNIEGLKKLTLQIEALNDQLEGLIYDVRFNSGICVGNNCGNPVEEAGDEYCSVCYKESQRQALEDTRHPDDVDWFGLVKSIVKPMGV